MNSGVSVPDYARPQTLTEALRLCAEGDWRLLAGGTDLYPGAGPQLSGNVLDMLDLPEFSGIRLDRGLRIGAATPWAVIAAAGLPPACRALQQAARQVGGVQVQNAGTIGGNLCNASPAADGVPPLLALGAEVELVSEAGVRRLGLAEFLLGPRRTALRPGEIMLAVQIPDTALLGRSAFVKLGARSHLVISIAMVAARLVVDGARVVEAAVAVGSCSPVAVRLAAVEAALVGAPVDEATGRVQEADVAVAMSPIDDVRATAAYRHEAAVELVRRAVAEALA
jgi:CO/xanthine dehydrogenase FAD-binding subunit